MRRLGLLSIAIGIVLAGCTPSSPAPARPAQAPVAVAATTEVASTTTPAPAVLGERKALGEEPHAVAEPVALDRSSPAAVIHGLEAAIARQDAAAIARLRAGTSSKPVLDERDALRAKLDFLGARANFWSRVFAAIVPADLEALDDTSSSTAKLHVVLGGSLGALDLGFKKEGDAWLAAF
jgi:hypothetical protein